ncbi:11214_t:CDS:10 [Paraglomus occultum]|uniref:11214_t:CDS:1 n=1 Tax=Paraglomus occultum TaxID=144539 RepID=A0A9N9CVX0_9GLOM|nr:11214_t:CDS:10 [Paraglomus occultum]
MHQSKDDDETFEIHPIEPEGQFRPTRIGDLDFSVGSWASRISILYDELHLQATEWNGGSYSLNSFVWAHNTDQSDSRLGDDDGKDARFIFCGGVIRQDKVEGNYPVIAALSCNTERMGHPRAWKSIRRIARCRDSETMELPCEIRRACHVQSINEEPIQQLRLDLGSNAEVGQGLATAGGTSVINGDANGYVNIWDVGAIQTYLNTKTGSLLPAHKMSVTKPGEKILSVAAQYDNSALNVYCTTDAGRLIACDPRKSGSPASTIDSAHNSAITTSAYHPTNAQLLLSGSSDGTVKWWDTRKMVSLYNKSPIPMGTLKVHTDRVNKVEWSPHHPYVFASCSDDKSVVICNCERVVHDLNNDYTFRHVGHKEKVTDISWHPAKHHQYTIGSVSPGSAENPGMIQVWRINSLVAKGLREGKPKQSRPFLIDMEID